MHRTNRVVAPWIESLGVGMLGGVGYARAVLASSFVRVIEMVFIDSVVLHRYWRCHRMPSRSLFFRGRQFHVCARCTGIILGLATSPIAFAFGTAVAVAFGIVILLNIIDGGTQWLGWRTSSNWMRLALGIGFGFTTLPAVLALVR